VSIAVHAGRVALEQVVEARAVAQGLDFLEQRE
jgi:hypothetical protein